MSADQAWSHFLDTARDCSGALLEAAPDDQAAAESQAYLGRLVSSVLAQTLDPGTRTIGGIYYPAARIGGQNPDYKMGMAPIDPNDRYRLSGRFNDAARIAVGLYTPQPQAALDMDDYRGLWPEQGAGFSITINVEGADLATKPSTALLMLRELQLRPGGKPAEVTLERLDVTAAPAAPAPEQALARAAGTLQAMITQFIRWSNVISRTPNTLIQMPAELDDVVRGDADTRYCTGHFDLAPEQALEIEMPETDAGYWMIQATNHWLEPIPGASRNNATIDPASRIVILGGADPGRPNWLDTQGRRHGQILARFVGGSGAPLPRVRLLDAGRDMAAQ